MRNVLVGSMALAALVACGSGGGGFLDGNVWDADAGGSGGSSSGGSADSGGSSSGSSRGGGSGGSSGAPGGSSGAPAAPSDDAGASDSGPVAAGPDAGVATPPGAAPACTSGTTWTGGTNGSSKMTPGQACISCHASGGGEAPTFTIAGTVYPSANEPDNCNGLANVTVVVTDANGQQLSLPTNSAGNFSSQTKLALPYQAKVVSGTKERAMLSAQSSGDCNSCHTATGTGGAPGRVMSP
jgi:hypothetical protein